MSGFNTEPVHSTLRSPHQRAPPLYLLFTTSLATRTPSQFWTSKLPEQIFPVSGANGGSRYQQFNPSHTWTISSSLINEARFTYMREGQLIRHPQSNITVPELCSSLAAQAVCFNGTSDSNSGPASIQADLAASGLAPTSPQLRHHDRLAGQSCWCSVYQRGWRICHRQRLGR